MENNNEVLLSVKDLWIEYTSDKRVIHAVNGVSFDLKTGESLGIVGESGCGKSTIIKALMRLLPEPPSRIPRGEILYKGQDVLKMSESKLQQLRGTEMAMIFQDPMTALNPTIRIGKQIMEMILQHQKVSKKEAYRQAVDMLKMVGIDESRFREFPHQFSGGMQQRVVVAIALACNPELLLADEPTTALDVTIQAQVLDMINDLIRKRGTTLLLITHNLGIVAEICEYVAVIYGGEIVEYGSIREIFKNPAHPYTIGLFNALPDINRLGGKLIPIPGIMPEPSDLPEGCKFHTRCVYATEECKHGPVPVVDMGGTHKCQCHRVNATGTLFNRESEE